METISFLDLLEVFKDATTLNKLNKDNFIAKEPVNFHNKDKGINLHFNFETPNCEDFFTIVVRLYSFEGYGNDDIKLFLIGGSLRGTVSKRIPNTYDDFFKTFIQLRDEYIEYKGEFRDSNKEEVYKENQNKIEKQKQLYKIASTLGKYV